MSLALNHDKCLEIIISKTEGISMREITLICILLSSLKKWIYSEPKVNVDIAIPMASYC